MHSINLSDPDVEVKPLHNSVLGQGHCFHVSTSQGSKYVSCTTSEERDKWMYSLKKTARPNEEHCRRSDSSLKLWVVEAKNLPVKKKFYCQILLDQTLYAKTSVKTMTDMLFWGEHFDFKSLPIVKTVTINLFREADKKKKKDKDTLVGYINLTVKDLENRQMIEKWITCNSGTVGKAGKETKSELAIIRIKARKQKVDILPLDAYQGFIKYLTTHYVELCSLLEPVLVVREKEEFATSLVHILQTQGKAVNFLCDIVMDEIDRLEDEHLTFRGNSIATKAMEAYMKLVGEKYLTDTLRDYIWNLIESPDELEVDPTKIVPPQLLSCNQRNLEMYCEQVWAKIINSFCYFPNEMREVFASLRTQCESRCKADYSDNLISGCIFLRFLCPAILYPNLFHLTQEYPGEKASRNLTLIAKTIQTLANFTKFGTKEDFMVFMNKFVENEEENMKHFLHKISSQDAGNEFLRYEGDIDLGKELSVLHCFLLECREKYSQLSGDQFEQLNNFLNSISGAFNDPSIGQKKPKRRSQIYDNMVPIQPSAVKNHPQQQNIISSTPSSSLSSLNSTKPIEINNRSNLRSTSSATGRKNKNFGLPSSPTEVLRDMLRHCGESVDDLPALSGNVEGDGASNSSKSRSRKSHSRSNSGDDDIDRDVSYDEEDDTIPATATVGKVRVGMVADVSGMRNDYDQSRINESWLQMVTAADNNLHGDYIDLIPFMDEDLNDSSVDGVDGNTTAGSQASLGGQSSTIGSSGYQSFSHSHSHSNSPVVGDSNIKAANHLGRHDSKDEVAELDKSPVIQRPQAVQPLAFANPLFGHQQQKRQQQSTGSSISTRGYAGPTPLVVPQPTPRQRHARTVQRKSSSDSTASTDDEDDTSRKTAGGKDSRRHKKRISSNSGAKNTNKTGTVSSSANAMSLDYQTSIAPLKQLSQLSSSSSDDDEKGNNSKDKSNSKNSFLGLRQKPVPGFLNRQYSAPLNNSSNSKNHNKYTLAPQLSLSTASSVQTQFGPPHVSTSTSSSSSSQQQTTFPMNGCSTFPRKHGRKTNGNEKDLKTGANNSGSPSIPPRQASLSSSSPAVPPKSSSSINAFLQRQTQHQQNISLAGGQPAVTRPSFPPRGITTNSSGHVQQTRQVLASSSSSSSSNSSTSSQFISSTLPRQHKIQQTHDSNLKSQKQQSSTTQSSIPSQSLQHSMSVDESKYLSSSRPTISRKPQRLIRQQPNQNSIETMIDPVETGKEMFQSTPVLNSNQRLTHQPSGAVVTTTVTVSASTTTANVNKHNPELSSTFYRNGESNSINSVNNSIENNSSHRTLKEAKHMQRKSSSHDTTSSSGESSPQSLARSSANPVAFSSNQLSKMQESSSAQSLSSAPLSTQSHGPSPSDSSSSISGITQPIHHRGPASFRSDSIGSLGNNNNIGIGNTGGVGSNNLRGMIPPPEIQSQSQSGSSTSINNNNNNYNQYNSNSRSSSNASLNQNNNNISERHNSLSIQRGNNNNSNNSSSHQQNANTSFPPRLSSRSDGNINAISNQPHMLTSSFSVANPIPQNPSPTSSIGGSSSNSTANSFRALSYRSPNGSPNVRESRGSYPASRSMDLSTLTRQPSSSIDPVKRTSVDSLLSQSDSLSPSGSLLSRDDIDGGRSSSASSLSNRRLSPQSAVHMGISSVQRKLQEQEKTKKEYECEVHGLRQQLLEAQERLQQAEMRLFDHEVDTHQLMDQWQSKLEESEEKRRKQQEEKDEKMNEIIARLGCIEDELKKEQEEMAQAVEQKQQVIEVQEQRIRTLDLANQKLLIALADLKGRALATQKQSLGNKTSDLTLEMAGLKTSSC